MAIQRADADAGALGDGLEADRVTGGERGACSLEQALAVALGVSASAGVARVGHNDEVEVPPFLR
jgi:hypothetical protein